MFILLLITTAVYSFTITSPDFSDGAQIPQKYTPYAQDYNPLIQVQGNYPEGTLSLAFAVNDPDAPNGLWSHWLVKDISPDLKTINENSIPGNQVTNSWNIQNYKGPKPPSGTHRYYFTLYALNVQTFDASNPGQFYDAVKQYTIESASYMGTYSSQK